MEYKIFENNYLFIRDCIYIPNQQIQDYNI